jgi:DNA-binding response OmpR family regulator
MKIILVEDDEVAMFVLETMVRKLGHTAICCSNGELALKVIDETVDLVITDWMLPKITGLELIERIDKKLAKKPPVLLISGMPDKILKEKAKNGAAQGVLSKPYTLQMLGSSINELTEEKGDRILFNDVAALQRCDQFIYP